MGIVQEHEIYQSFLKVHNKLLDNGSVSAIVPMSVINTLGFDLPQTGENGTWLFAVGGVLIVSLSAAFIFFILAKKRKTDEQ